MLNCTKKPLQDLTFAIVGMGLIGGSYAKALRRAGVKKILGMDISHGIAKACLNSNMIDEIVDEKGEAIKEADVVIISVYPEAIVDFVEKHAASFSPGTLVTDAVGVKGNMPPLVQGLMPEGTEFVSGHPMAGRQGSGIGMSDADIFINSNYIIVPTEKNTKEAVSFVEDMAKALGCRTVVKVGAKEHDRIIAYTSHLPHITAVSLVNSASYNENTRYFVAGGFKDATRVADINPELWSDLFLSNREAVLAEIDNYSRQLDRWKKALEDNDREALKDMMKEAGPKRRTLY